MCGKAQRTAAMLCCQNTGNGNLRIGSFSPDALSEGMTMRKHCEILRNQVNANFVNLETAIKTYDRNALVCGTPAWRYVYHTIHSTDKWFINPFYYSEPEYQQPGMDNPDNPCKGELSDQELLDYLYRVWQKTFRYIDELDDEKLYEKPQICPYTRFELVLMQFRHISFHTGMLNGQTAERTGKFPVFVSPHSMDRLMLGLYDEGKEKQE